MSAVGSGVAAILAGVLDGLGASRDQNEGRHWDSPSASLLGMPNLEWGWAPGAQMASLVFGIAAQLNGWDWGRGLTAAGAGMAARAATFNIAQKGAAKAQGYLADGTNVPPGAPRSHYVSTYGGAHGFRSPPFSSDDPATQFGGRISAARVPPFDDEFGGRISGYLADGSNVPPGVPQSHYVSTYPG
jgi:hypothetical protein